jgi:hypothetical protein
MLYLLDYESVITMGPNILMNKDDYLHFILVLSAFPQLTKFTNLDKLLVEKMTEVIV